MEIGGEWLYDTVLTGAAAEAAYARVVSQLKLRMEQLFIQQGNEFASTRARAHYYVEGAADEACTGVSYYHFLCNLLEKADWAALGAKLDAVRSRVLQKRCPDRQPARHRGRTGKAAHPAAGKPLCRCPAHPGAALHPAPDAPGERSLYH